jgi:hypothetical protein
MKHVLNLLQAGNANGTSQLTPPIKFITADKYIIETKGNNKKIKNTRKLFSNVKSVDWL